MEMTKIGVLLSVYHGDKKEYIQQALDSILQQSYQDFIIFVGIDGPVSNSVKDFLISLEVQDNVLLMWFPQNRGLACVLNDIVKMAKDCGCEYLARMDADDISLPGRFEKQALFLESHPEVDVVGGAIEEIDEHSKLRGKRVVYPLTHDACKRFFRYRDPLAHPAVMFRKRFFDKVCSLYRDEYRKNQDTMLWFDGFRNGCIFANIKDTVLHFRVTDDFYSKRRHGWKRAKKMLMDRMMINHGLHYDISANLFAVAMFFITLMPPSVIKIMYRLR